METWSSGLWIMFPDDNPYMKAENYNNHFIIPLTKDISPYGGLTPDFSVTYKRAGELIPGVDFVTLSVKMPDAPDVAKKINDALQVWVEGFPENTEAINQLGWYANEENNDGFRFSPRYGHWDNYLDVSYYLAHEGSGSAASPLMYLICFDMDTGAVVNMTEKLPKNIDYSKAYCLYGASWWTANGMRSHDVPADNPGDTGYIPANGSVISNAVTDFTGNPPSIALYVTEPSGRVLAYSFAFEDLE
jgi:hypothetical protein